MFKNKIFFFFALTMLLGVFTINSFAVKNFDALKVTVNFEKNSFGYDESVPVNVSIRNDGKTSIRILRWLTPFDGVKDDLFAVTIDGKSVEYIGPDYKRPAPTEKDYITLEAGESFQTTVDLAGYYDLSQTGFYQVSYQAETVEGETNPSLMTAKSEQPEALRSEVIQTWVTGTRHENIR